MAFITQFWPEMPNTTIILPADEKRVFRLWELVDLSLCRKSTQCLEMNRNFKKKIISRVGTINGIINWVY